MPVAIDALEATSVDFGVHVKKRTMLSQLDFVLDQLSATADDTGERKSFPELGVIGGIEQVAHFGYWFVGSFQVDERVGFVPLGKFS